MQVKKFYIRVLAILMAVTIAVTTPLSDFADIKGMKQTHAVAPTLITLGGLFGAIAGAYGLYVATDKIADYAENWFNWTADNATDARTDLQKIKDGVTGYVITKAVIKSVADYLGSIGSSVESVTYKGAWSINSLPDTEYTEAVFRAMQNKEQHFANYIPMFCHWVDNGSLSGVYNFVCVPNSTYDELLANGSTQFAVYTLKSSGTKSRYVLAGFDSSGNNVATITSSQVAYRNIQAKFVSGSLSTALSTINVVALENPSEYAGFSSVMPLYHTAYDTLISSRTLDEIKEDGFYTAPLTIDYKVHGNNALDNTNALEGAEVTQAQLEAMQQAVEKEYSNVVQFPNSDGDNEEEPDTQALANAITLAVLSTLQNMGYIKNPTDEPSGENVKEQLGKIEIAVDGMTDAMAQNNRLLENVFDAVQGLASNIGNAVSVAFQNALDALFVPDTEAVENLTNDFFDKFPWTHTLFDYTDDIKKAFLSSEPPKIYIHFQDSKDSKYHSIGTQLAFDASWYAPYKPTGDMILSVFIYALFLWRLFKNIPNIMSGLGMMTEQPIRFEDNMVKNGKG